MVMSAVDENHDEENHEAGDDSSDDDDSSSSDDDSLALDGMLYANPDASSSSDDDDDLSSEEESDDDDAEAANAGPPTKKRKQNSAAVDDASSKGKNAKKKAQSKKKSKKNKDDPQPEIINCEFIFCDMAEKFFHGIKTHLMCNNPVHAPHSSALSDLMTEHVSVGTVIAQEGDDENNVYGFASVLNVTTNGSVPCIQHLKKLCLDHCPPEHASLMGTVLSGTTKRPAGFLIHGRMVNLPLEITEVLHQQLVLDMDWAVEHAEGGPEERKSLDFGAFVRMAPTTPGPNGTEFYKHFDDEVFASNAEFTFTFAPPKTYATEEKQLCTVIVMTKTGHRQAMKDIAKLIQG
jgi:protein BCP1